MTEFTIRYTTSEGTFETRVQMDDEAVLQFMKYLEELPDEPAEWESPRDRVL